MRRVAGGWTVRCVREWGIANRPAAALGLGEGDRAELERLTRAPSVRAGLVQRAGSILLAADGVANTENAAWVG